MIGMSQAEAEVMTHCQRCNGELRGGYNWRGELVGEGEEKEMRVVEVICFPCAKKERYSAYQKSKTITSRLLTDAYYLKNAELSASIESINIKIKDFEEQVWFGGLQTVVREEPMRGMKYVVNDFTFMSYVMAGRCMMTMERADGVSITVLTSDTGSDRVMGIQGIYATETDAISLLNKAISFHKMGILPIANTEVGL